MNIIFFIFYFLVRRLLCAWYFNTKNGYLMRTFENGTLRMGIMCVIAVAVATVTLYDLVERILHDFALYGQHKF